MQFNGIGEGHGAEMHQVTNCMHDHSHYRKPEPLASASSAAEQPQTLESVRQELTGQFSLSAWLAQTLKGGGKFLRGFWDGGGSEVSGDGGGRADKPSVMARQDADRTPQAAEASMASLACGAVGKNPYFSALGETGSRRESLWQKARVRFKDAAGYLAGHLPGNFFNAKPRNSFQAGQQRPREDPRKRSRFHGDQLEIDCFLTDDSYLLDSYDRKGEYSKLSAKK